MAYSDLPPYRGHDLPVYHGRSSTGGGDIPVTTLDAVHERWTAEHDGHSLAFVKIDVEGMELDVLSGARDVLERLHPPLFVEAVTPTRFNELDAFLGGFGYRCLGRLARTPVYHFHFRPDAPRSGCARGRIA